VGLAIHPSAHAAMPNQQQSRCFKETGQCIGGRFREYWEQNGGLAVFGFPTSAAQNETNRDTGKVYMTQWFERARLELHLENQAPYDVLLGRMGEDRLLRLDRDWKSGRKAPSTAAHYFPQTGHAIAHEPFWRYWSTHGLELGDRGVSERESLALFGYPLTEPTQETNLNGDTVLTQWFERARFEWHPNKPEPYKVLLGLLGNELRPTTSKQLSDLPTNTVWIRSGERLTAANTERTTFVLQQQGQPSSPFSIAVAPDGSAIAYVEIVAGTNGQGLQLVVIDRQTNQRRTFSQIDFATISAPRFSPDSRTIAFSIMNTAASNWELRLLDLRTYKMRVLRQSADARLLQPIAWSSAGIFAHQLMWGTDAPPQALVLIDPEDGTISPIRQRDHLNAVPAPNSSRIAFVTGSMPIGETPEQTLLVLDRKAGSETTLLPKQKTLIRHVRWSPDSARLLYTQATDYTRPITMLHLINPDGSGKQSVDLATLGLRGEIKDTAWRNPSTLLLLTVDTNQQLHLYELPTSTPNRASLKELSTFNTGSVQDAQDHILYVPR
jgi:dipeptidyl aminopeptidase/acylaminoacyl peptidase